MTTSQQLNLLNYGSGWHILKEKDKKCQRAKNEFVGAYWWGADFINPSKLGLDRTRYDPSQSAF